jgi:hypothetical protein
MVGFIVLEAGSPTPGTRTSIFLSILGRQREPSKPAMLGRRVMLELVNAGDRRSDGDEDHDTLAPSHPLSRGRHFWIG